MDTKTAIDLAGNATALATMLGITVSAVSQWGDTIPESRIWQLRVLRPEWFTEKAARRVSAEAAKA